MSGFAALAFGFSWICFLACLIPNRDRLSMDGLLPYLMAGQFGPTRGRADLDCTF